MIPCCFHPTRVVLIDDCPDLRNFQINNLSRYNLTFDVFTNYNIALHYINEIYQPEPFYDRYQLEQKKGPRKSHFSPQALDTYHEIYRPQRFDEISALVVNYLDKSFQLGGLELFECVQNPHIQKILLVEEEDKAVAIQALADGFIDDFVCKHQQGWKEQLCESLQAAQWRYFNQLSRIFMRTIQPGAAKEYALDDPNFQEFFKEILSSHGFTEAYLCETTGSYLFLDDQAQDHGLVVNIAEQLDSWVRTGQAKGINPPLLNALKDRKKMMCYRANYRSLEPDKHHWEIYAHPLKKIKGQRSTYYYVFAPNVYDIDVERILPFEEYREYQHKKGEKFH